MFDYKTIAHEIFNDNYKQQNSIKLEFSEYDFEYIFQTIINIYMEGLLIKKYDLNKLTTSDFNIMNHYMKSINFNTIVEQKEFIDDHYCTTKLIDGECKFSINPQFYQKYCDTKELSNYKAILKTNKMFIISFEFNT